MARARAGDIVSRRKGLVMHKGVSLGNGLVLHNTPGRGEHVATEEEFRAGKRMYTQRVGGAVRRPSLARSQLEYGRRYHLLNNNCEHTVNRAVHGDAHSPQLRGWLVGAGMAAATFAVTRHPVLSAAAFALGQRLGGRRRR